MGNFTIRVNEEDHLTLISQADDHQLHGTYDRLPRAMNRINEELEFQQHRRLGYVTCSPMNLGTTLRMNVCGKLFRMENIESLVDLGKKLDLHVETTNEENVYRMSNVIRLGRTEFHIVRRTWNNIQAIVERDQPLS